MSQYYLDSQRQQIASSPSIPKDRLAIFRRESAYRPSRVQALLGFFFALTGALIATSIFNIGDSGVPLFCLALIVPVIEVVFPIGRTYRATLARKEFLLLLSMEAIFLLLCATTFLQLAVGVQSPERELPHAAIRLLFLVYCSICIYFLQGESLLLCLRWLRRILAFIALYGIYQLPAKLLGLPLFLDWLRNNQSFFIYDYNTAGWVRMVRATSIYAEPAQCIVPVVVLILLNIYVPASRISKAIVWFVAIMFAILTFSRTIWFAILALIVAFLISRTSVIPKLFRRHTIFVAILLLSVTLLMPIWAFVGSNNNTDLSRQERAGSIVIGLQLVKEHPWLGSGWNSYEILMPSYMQGVEGVSPDVEYRTIHNMFVSYAEQAGLGGFIFALFPFAIMLFKSEAPFGLKIGSVLPLLIVGELGGDVAYSSLFWLWVAIVLNWPESNEVGSINSGECPSALYKLHR